MLSPLCDLVSNSIAVASKPQIVDIDFDEELEKKVVRKIDWVHKFYNLVIVSTNLYLFLSIISLRMTIQFCRKRKKYEFPSQKGLLYVENMAYVMANASTLTPPCRSAQNFHNPYVDDEVEKCIDL